ncbi:uncharacterized protein LOC129591801 [Paramacrobiotus metropolitanus]|uniref:uncharacterized protein LOC129591801 n=1 Tax=Paramacrobiotus metropolitanus TaxID=2943436 RepID=UPI00244594BA|nr:uncharacterized protein LOC129591801 [Paramacrobiotus metropolitanus]
MQSSALARRVLDPRHKSAAANGALSDFPFPRQHYDADDDLLSHYASPKQTYDPLPLALFPRPDPHKEQYESACFPCFKYYDLNKYSLQDAIRLSAMDIIPKDALKSVKEQPQRAKRLKRSTAESALVAGYYRNKNEGLEVDYHLGRGGPAAKTTDGGRPGRTRRAAEEPPEKATPLVFKSILDLGRATGGGRSQSPKPAGPSAASKAPAAAKAPPTTGPNGNGGVTAKKQGKRTEFLAHLRQEMRPATAQPGMSRLDQQLRAGGPRRTRGQSMVAPPPPLPAALPPPIPSLVGLSSARRKAPIVTVQQRKTRPAPAAARPPPAPALDTSSSMDEEKMAAEALGVIAHEELGDSDEEVYPYY